MTRKRGIDCSTPAWIISGCLATVLLDRIFRDFEGEKKEPALGDCRFKCECRHIHELLEANRELAEKLDKIHAESDLE